MYFCKKSLSNTYFQFKEFKINQEHCAMKVCTDSCLQGAIAAKTTTRLQPLCGLDIGAGTGLLSLMVAQMHSFDRLDAVEINEAACQQAYENIKNTTIGKNIRIIHDDIRTFHPPQSYDFIICNPPFYANDLKSRSVTKNMAMHSSHLMYEELLQKIELFLSPSGTCCIMIPTQKEEIFKTLAFENKLFPTQIYHIKNRPDKNSFRSILFLSKKESVPIFKEICIRDNRRQYSSDFRELLRPYYLHL